MENKQFLNGFSFNKFNVKAIALSLSLGLALAAGITFAWNAVWHGTDWIQSGKVINAKAIAESLEYLYQRSIPQNFPACSGPGQALQWDGTKIICSSGNSTSCTKSIFHSTFPDAIVCNGVGGVVDSVIYYYNGDGPNNVVGYETLATMGGARGWIYFSKTPQQKIINGNWSLRGDCVLGTTLAQIKRREERLAYCAGRSAHNRRPFANIRNP